MSDKRLTDERVVELSTLEWVNDGYMLHDHIDEAEIRALASELLEYRRLDMLRVHVTIRQPAEDK